jgi:hypothetical protein
MRLRRCHFFAVSAETFLRGITAEQLVQIPTGHLRNLNSPSEFSFPKNLQLSKAQGKKKVKINKIGRSAMESAVEGKKPTTSHDCCFMFSYCHIYSCAEKQRSNTLKCVQTNLKSKPFNKEALKLAAELGEM